MTSDFEIILEVLAGNQNAYAKLVRQYEGKVRGYCAAMLSDSTQAEDAAQEVFIKVFYALDKFRGNSSFSTWLYRITVNHCHDTLRKIIRRKAESWEALLEKEGDKIEKMFSAPAAGVTNLEQQELLHKILSQLPEKSREIIILREKEGLSYQEMADTLECTVDAVKARLKRARQELEVKVRHLLATKGV